MNRLEMNPTINIKRSKFDMPNMVTTTFNAGYLIPLGEPIEVLPGDTFRLDLNSFVRMQTPVKAPMDNLDLTVASYFVPNRLVYDHFEEVMGDNKEGPWNDNKTEYEIPTITAPATTGWKEGTVADYFGIPTKVTGFAINHLPFRAYCLIFNDWYRNENLQDYAYLTKDENQTTGTNGTNWITDAIKGGALLPVSKKADYFTTCLPDAQKGGETTIPIVGDAPVIGNGKALGITDGTTYYGLTRSTSGLIGGTLQYEKNVGTEITGGSTVPTGITLGISDEPEGSGLIADLSQALSPSINSLRQAYQIQKYKERDAIFGTRYIEFLKGHFSVTSPDARLQRSEYLGGKNIPINITPIIQTSGSVAGGTPQGNIAGNSATADSSHIFTKSFVEHGFIINVACVRVHRHTYQQGVSRFWLRKNKFDYYDPLFSTLGNQKVNNIEIFAQNDSVVDSDGNPVNYNAFGYQEYGADYRFRKNLLTGEMRSNATGTQSVWTFADNYASLPTLGSTWIAEDKTNIDKALTVTSANANQFLGNFYFKLTAVRPMPLYSIPGYVDHH